jgi:hypothetical protein
MKMGIDHVLTVVGPARSTIAGGGSVFGAAARSSSQLQRGVSETWLHVGVAAASASSDGSCPRACCTPAQVGLLRLTSVTLGPMRANGSPSFPSTTTGSGETFSTKMAGTRLAETTWILTPAAGAWDDFWTMA